MPPDVRRQSSASNNRDGSSNIEVSMLADGGTGANSGNKLQGVSDIGKPLTFSDQVYGRFWRGAYVAAGFFFLGFAAGFGSITGSDPRSTEVRRPLVKV